MMSTLPVIFPQYNSAFKIYEDHCPIHTQYMYQYIKNSSEFFIALKISYKYEKLHNYHNKLLKDPDLAS